MANRRQSRRAIVAHIRQSRRRFPVVVSGGLPGADGAGAGK